MIPDLLFMLAEGVILMGVSSFIGETSKKVHLLTE